MNYRGFFGKSLIEENSVTLKTMIIISQSVGLQWRRGFEMRRAHGFLLCLIVFASTLSSLQSAFSPQLASTNTVSVDVFTEKEPYSGKGANQPSDAFQPQEEVILHALVSYNGDPAPRVLVGFEVHGPINPIENITQTRTAETDSSGIATINFTVPWPSQNAEQVVFGSWSVLARENLRGSFDTLSFEVGWIVETLSVETVDTQNVPKTEFLQGETMRFKITVKNIAMTGKVATFTVAALDSLGFNVGQVVLRDEFVPPGTTIYYIGNLTIPEKSTPGAGVAFTNAYTSLPELGGKPWCPEIKTNFSIIATKVHDVAVIKVEPSPINVYQGGMVNVSVVVKNNGEETESFTVNVLFDSSLIGESFSVENLVAGANRTLAFSLNTSGMVPAQYVLSATASPVPGESRLEDNTFVYGTVSVLPLPPLLPPPPLRASIAPETSQIALGSSVRFASAVSGGTHPYTYQWYLNGFLVTDATTLLWLFTPTTAGEFNVFMKATDSLGATAQSNTVTVQVTTPPLPLELSWLLLLIALIGGGLLGFFFGRRSRKDRGSQQKSAYLGNPYANLRNPSKGEKKTASTRVYPRCGMYSAVLKRRI